jgi:hypothetical protein
VRESAATTYREGMRQVARVGAGVAAGLLALMGAGVMGGTAGAQDEAALGGFGTLARATGVRIFYDSEKSPNPYPPTFEGTIPEVVASYEAGVGRAFASIIWPGPLLGNLGNVTPLLLPPGPITELSKNLNWPLRAEATSSDTEPEQTLEIAPGSGMRAYADDRKTEAQGSFEQYGTPDVISVGTISSHTINRVEADKVVAEAVSAAEDIAIGPGGLITIESVKSIATASSDGKQGTSDAHTTIAGVKVAGMPATLDENGLTLASQSLGKLLDPIVEQANKVLEAVGFELIYTPVEKISQEGDVSASASSSGLLFRITGTIPPLPQELSQVPLGGAQEFYIQLASVNASAAASGAFIDGPGDINVDLPLDVAPTDTGLGGDLPIDSGAGLDLPPTDVALPPTGTGSGTGNGGGGAAPTSTQLIGYSGVPIGAFVLALLGSVLLAGWLRRMPDRVLAAPGSSCDQA